MRFFPRRSIGTLCLAVATIAPAPAQVRDLPAGQGPVPAAAGDAAALAAGWTALAGGRFDAAARAADDILKRVPWNHAATALKIEALAAADPLRGLDAYEAWLGPRTDEDPGLLEPVPRAVLLQIARGTDPTLKRDALRFLTRAGVRGAAEPPPADQSPDARFAADAALAGAGDAAALKRLETAAQAADVPDKTAAAGALEAAGPAGVPALITMLQGTNGPSRAAAAGALGRLKADDARAGLKQLMGDPDPYVRSSAAVALARLGDKDGQAAVQQMLQSEVPDMRLMAAEAWDGQNGPWVSAVLPLLDNQDGLTRLHAARLLAPIDPDRARRVLQDASKDPNPVIRAEAVTITEQMVSSQPGLADIPQLRRLLRDRDAAIRLPAAGSLLELARGPRL